MTLLSRIFGFCPHTLSFPHDAKGQWQAHRGIPNLHHLRQGIRLQLQPTGEDCMNKECDVCRGTGESRDDAYPVCDACGGTGQQSDSVYKVLAETRAERDKVIQEAQIHAQEAKTANATIAEIYQLCTGATGEPGNWNGAEPVRQLVAELARLREALRPLYATCEDAPELNMSNYDEDQVAALNSAMIEVCLGLRALLHPEVKR